MAMLNRLKLAALLVSAFSTAAFADCQITGTIDLKPVNLVCEIDGTTTSITGDKAGSPFNLQIDHSGDIDAQIDGLIGSRQINLSSNKDSVYGFDGADLAEISLSHDRDSFAIHGNDNGGAISILIDQASLHGKETAGSWGGKTVELLVVDQDHDLTSIKGSVNKLKFDLQIEGFSDLKISGSETLFVLLFLI